MDSVPVWPRGVGEQSSMLVAPKAASACQPDGLPASPERFGQPEPEPEADTSGPWPTPLEPSIDQNSNQDSAGREPGKASFPRSARLLKPADFKRVFKNASVSADRYIKVLGSFNSSGCSRLGMAVSRQVDKHAVGRNRIKRIIREYFRHSFPVENERFVDGQPVGIDFVVLPRRESATISNRQLTASLATHCLRIVRALESRRGARDRQTPRPGSGQANQAAGTT